MKNLKFSLKKNHDTITGNNYDKAILGIQRKKKWPLNLNVTANEEFNADHLDLLLPLELEQNAMLTFLPPRIHFS
jgi:hypothetical protein